MERDFEKKKSAGVYFTVIMTSTDIPRWKLSFNKKAWNSESLLVSVIYDQEFPPWHLIDMTEHATEILPHLQKMYMKRQITNAA